MRVTRRPDGKASIHMSQESLERLLALVEIAELHEDDEDASPLRKQAARGLSDLDSALRAFARSPEWSPRECCDSYQHQSWCSNK